MSKQVLSDLRMVEEVLERESASLDVPMDPELAARITDAEDRACAALERLYQNERPLFEQTRLDPITRERIDAWPEARQHWLESEQRAAWLVRSAASPAFDGGGD